MSINLAAAESNGDDDLNQDRPANQLENQLNPLQQEALKQKQQRHKKKNVIYQWVDENGNTIMSDVPREGAKEIPLPEPQTYSPRKLKAASDEPPELFKPKEMFDKTPPKLKIIEPVNDSWLGNNQGNLQISVAITPGLRPGQILVMKLDGTEISRGILNQLKLQGLDRGSHVLTVEVQMKNSKKPIASSQSTFYVRRPSVNH